MRAAHPDRQTLGPMTGFSGDSKVNMYVSWIQPGARLQQAAALTETSIIFLSDKSEFIQRSSCCAGSFQVRQNKSQVRTGKVQVKANKSKVETEALTGQDRKSNVQNSIIASYNSRFKFISRVKTGSSKSFLTPTSPTSIPGKETRDKSNTTLTKLTICNV